MASRPLGAVRGTDGLTHWEYFAFEEVCASRYQSGDDEREENEDEEFEFYQQLSEYNEITCMDQDDEPVVVVFLGDDDDEDIVEIFPPPEEADPPPPFVYVPRKKSSLRDPFAHLSFPKPVPFAPGPMREPKLVPCVDTLINSSIDQSTEFP